VPTRRSRFGASRRRPGFTLLEVLLALALIIMLMGGVFGFYITTLQVRETGRMVAHDALLAHSLLKQMAEEIRHAKDVVPGDGTGFHGTHNRITIVRASLPELYAFNDYDSVHDQLPPAQMDVRRITYELIWDEELVDDEGVALCHGLLRSEQRTFDPNPRFVVQDLDLLDVDPEEPGAPPVDTELFAPEIKFLQFEYFDGAEWRDRWHKTDSNPAGEAGEEEEIVIPGMSGNEGQALPQAVRITIGKIRVPLEDQEFDITQLKTMEERNRQREQHADRFTIVVRLLEADQSMLSSRQFGARNATDLQVGGS
jgi:type II secretory pathway pseudopilin PulG